MKTGILRRWAALAAAGWLAAGHGAVAADGDWVPTRAQVGELEARLTTGADRPTSSRPPQTSLSPDQLRKAARFYYGAIADGTRVIRGEILRMDDQRPGVTIQSDFPIVMDGGCSVINVLYDVERHRFIRFECNGMA